MSLLSEITGNPSSVTVRTALSGGEILPMVLTKAKAIIGDQISKISAKIMGNPIIY